jgi:hypothetical protein
MHLTERDAKRALVGSDCEFGLGKVDEFPEGIAEERSVLRNAYNPAYHHPVSHILPTEHVSPPPAEILGSANVVGGSGGIVGRKHRSQKLGF